MGATLPHHGAIEALGMEIVLTFLLVTVILGTATNHSLTGPNAAIAVGGTIALLGLFAVFDNGNQAHLMWYWWRNPKTPYL